MFVEDGFSWDNEREATALDWPPLLTPELEQKARSGAPREVRAAAGEAVAGISFGDDGRIVIPVDPDLTEAELSATSIDSMVGAAFFPSSLPLPDDEAAEATDVIVEPPLRSSRSKGPLIMVGAAVTVALSAGYTANALGWRLPPALLEIVQPMTTFFRDLKTARLVDLMEKLRLAGPTNDPAPSREPEVVQPPVGPMSGAASEPMSLFAESHDQEVTMSLPAPASTPDSARASDEGIPATLAAPETGAVVPPDRERLPSPASPASVRSALHPNRAREPNPRRRAESRRAARSSRRDSPPRARH